MKRRYEPISLTVICLSADDVVTASAPDWDLGEPDPN